MNAHSKKEIQEAISFWKRQLETAEFLESFGSGLQEGEDTQKIEGMKDAIRQNIQSADDVRKFVAANDKQVQKAGDSKIRRAWNFLKKAVARSAEFIYDHWLLILLVILAVILFFSFGWSPEEVEKMLKASGNAGELQYMDAIQKYNSLPWFDDGTVGSF